MKHHVNFSILLGIIGQIILFLVIPLIYFLLSCTLKEVTICFESSQIRDGSIQVFYNKGRSAFNPNRSVTAGFNGRSNFQVPVILPLKARIDDEIRVDIRTDNHLKLKITQITVRSIFRKFIIAGKDLPHAASLVNLDISGSDNGIPVLITRSDDPQIVLNKDWKKFASIRHGIFFRPLAGLASLQLWIFIIIISCELLFIVLLHPGILARAGFLGKYLAAVHSNEKTQSSNVCDQRCGQRCDSTGRLTFLDVLKGVAMIAVICDHCKVWSSLCPLNFLPHPITFYSVALFILCAGYTSALSLDHSGKKGMSSFLWVRKKVVHIAVCYLVGTAVYLFCTSPEHLIQLSSFINCCVNFNASAPFYFLAFFLQLLCIAPFSYHLFSSRGGKYHDIWKVFFYFCAILFSCWCIKYTRIGNIYGGGNFLFGGSFLILYVTGQIIYIYRGIFFGKTVNLCLLIMTFSHFMLLRFSYFNSSFVCRINPPGLLLIFYAAAIFFGVSFLFRFYPDFWSAILSPVSFLGKHSLEIFIYHNLVIGLSNNYIRIGPGGSFTVVQADPNWKIFFPYAVVFPDTPFWRFFLGTAVFAGCLLVPVIFAVLYRYGKKWLTAYMQGDK